jgi:hypothetical protein
VLEDLTDSKLTNYSKELQELVREPVLCDIWMIVIRHVEVVSHLLAALNNPAHHYM